ncbi:replication initiation protein [Bacteroides thetaiotaomicron]|uniref:replication initiation protein n=1 Tax=Bacteroides thetaiotaomicron TaxID=818 RepID=UPI00286E0B8B|nr:replication initiation protein [Bacteroides thetaiotaomicron]MCS2264263.1 replication initiation protein [Bacteroides thetaiotaomicron]
MSENLPNKAVFQSYIWTCAKYDFSPYEKRIIYRLIEFAQRWLEGIKIKDHMHKIEPSDCGVNITMPVASILRDEDDHNYAKAKAAFTSLSKKGAEYEDDKIWFYTAIIEHPKIEKGTGIATFHVYDPIWRAALDFTKGFKKYELITAMKFKSVYAMRFYELMSGQTQPLFVSLEGSDGLRERFCLQGKYERVNDFKRYVIDAAKKNLMNPLHTPLLLRRKRKERRSLAGPYSLYSLKTEKTLHYRNKRAWLKLRHGSSWRTTYMTTSNSPLTSSLMKSTRTRKPLSRGKTASPISWGSWEN